MVECGAKRDGPSPVSGDNDRVVATRRSFRAPILLLLASALASLLFALPAGAAAATPGPLPAPSNPAPQPAPTSQAKPVQATTTTTARTSTRRTSTATTTARVTAQTAGKRTTAVTKSAARRRTAAAKKPVHKVQPASVTAPAPFKPIAIPKLPAAAPSGGLRSGALGLVSVSLVALGGLLLALATIEPKFVRPQRLRRTYAEHRGGFATAGALLLASMGIAYLLSLSAAA